MDRLVGAAAGHVVSAGRAAFADMASNVAAIGAARRRSRSRRLCKARVRFAALTRPWTTNFTHDLVLLSQTLAGCDEALRLAPSPYARNGHQAPSRAGTMSASWRYTVDCSRPWLRKNVCGRKFVRIFFLDPLSIAFQGSSPDHKPRLEPDKTNKSKNFRSSPRLRLP